ncbi:MAG TPA: SRPBCC family protein [Egicoccus sp.]|nr:SRPBCC family protein [Egicoccus sp.]HSK23946.1 SRPBCC family protein [Egicoccus sp.]
MAAIDLTGTWRTTAPADAVWAVIVDLTTWPLWWPAIDDVEVLAGTAVAPEAARVTFGTPVRPLRVEMAVTATEAQRLDVVTVGGPVRGTGRLGLVDEPDLVGAGGVTGFTAVRFALRLDVRSLLFKPVERILAGAARGSGSERLRQAGDDLARLAGGEPGHHEV